MTVLTRRAARTARAGFTLVELAVVLALIGVLAAAIIPRLDSQSVASTDTQAQATASAALDTAVSVWLSAGGYGTGTGPGPAALTLGPRDPALAPGTEGGGSADPVQANALGSCTDPGSDGSANYYASAPHGTPQTGQYPIGQPTNCPVFAHPYTLGQANGDITFTAGDQASTDAATASVAALDTPAGWRIAAAVLSPTGSGGPGGGQVATCMILWQQFAAPGQSVASHEEYFAATDISGPGDTGTVCTGNSALSYTTSADDVVVGGGAGDPYCSAPGRNPDGTEIAPYGTSWRRPCPTFGSKES